MGRELSEIATFDFLEQADIGGTNAQNAGGYLTMLGYDRVFAKVELGTWDSGDDLDECRIQQASDSSGTGVKDFTTDASGGNYDTDAPIDADGDQVIIEARQEKMDAGNDFNHVRLYVAEGGNSGTDNVFGVFIRYDYHYPHEQLDGTASAGSIVYVRPS